MFLYLKTAFTMSLISYFILCIFYIANYRINCLHSYVYKSGVRASTTSRPRPPWFPENQPNSWADLAPASSSSPPSTAVVSSSTGSADVASPIPAASGEQKTVQEHSDDTAGGSSSGLPDKTDKVIKVKVPKPFPPTVTSPRRLGGGSGDIPPTPEATLDDDATIKNYHNQHQIIRHHHHHDNAGGGGDGGGGSIALSNYTHYCGPVTARGLFWNWTRAGDTAVLECPGGSVGFAKWRCGLEPPVDWLSLAPSLAECQVITQIGCIFRREATSTDYFVRPSVCYLMLPGTWP